MGRKKGKEEDPTNIIAEISDIIHQQLSKAPTNRLQTLRNYLRKCKSGFVTDWQTPTKSASTTKWPCMRVFNEIIFCSQN